MTMTVSQFWNVRYPVGNMTWREIGADEAGARALACAASLRYCHAKVTNREGLVATYVDGVVFSGVGASDASS